jgi:FkbM family methyltransferase
VGLITLADRPLFSSVVPSKLFEAMGHGVPVLISVPEGEATALVRREGCGVVVPPANPRALAEAVRELARSPARIAELRARALAAAPHHSRERHAAHMLRLLEQVAGSGSGLRARASSPALSPVRGLRSLLYRAGRKLYQHARREGANDPRQNGEYRLLSAALERAGNEPLVLLDVGAHRGDWSAEAARQLARLGLRGEIHAFEPTPETHAELSRRLAGEPRVVARALALSDREGTLPLYVAGALAGTNSLEDQGLGPALDVQATSVDRFLSEQHIERVTFLKCDAEGHDLAVLRGGARSLAAGRVDVWQFEYNARWIYARAFLRDVFELARGTPYSIGKVHRHGVELFESWHPELERYFETNFVLLRRGSPFESLGRRVRFDRSNSPR